MPWPVPEWGWEICETPWTVQSLWWHYIYTMDQQFLEQRAYEPIKEAVLFLVDYMKRPEAHGAQWRDDKYHVFPTVVPELYELTPGFTMNYDCLLDLTLIKFIFKAFVQACTVLQKDEAESELLNDVEEILQHFPAYPTTESKIGQVFISVPDESPETIYNVPNSVATIFPGEDHGIHSSPEEFTIAANSFLNHRNEGGNDLVFHNMAGARLGILDLERFKRQVQYCMLPNGTCADRILLSGGRYADHTSFDWMNTLGIWFENFSLPAVINECLMQSYNGVIRLFPNWTEQHAAEFRTLRAAGGFLVSARIESGVVQWIEIESLAGAECKLFIPWDTGAKLVNTAGAEKKFTGNMAEWSTTAGEKIRLTKI
jgi:alpha-L-fucosidase 2